MNSSENYQHQTLRVPVAVRWPTIIGLLAILSFFGGFGVWALTAQLAGATIAPGLIVANGQNKVIQHLEGGIIKEILVTEGQRIEAGDPVFKLDRTAVEANLNRLTSRRDVNLAYEARFLAERDNYVDIKFPVALVERSSLPHIKRLLNDQRAEFLARLNRHKNELAILGKKIQAFEEEIIGVKAHNESIDTQLELINQELVGVTKLFDKGLTTQVRLLSLKRTKAGLRGDHSRNIAKISTVRQQVLQIKEEIHRSHSTRQEQASASLSKIRAELHDTKNLIHTATDVLDRIVVRSPISGTIVKIDIHTIGGVIQSGQTLLEILPNEAELLVEARVPLADIDSVKVGQIATIMFSALDQNKTPVVSAKVAYVSADRLVDPVTNQPYYLARIHLNDLDETELDLTDLYPGMQVDTFIKTKDRTFLGYLVRPIRDSFQKAFREN